ncbi:RNA recognition motif family protein [Theileria parva strain Muguga]|uniref:Spliceosome associated protein, putative n=1 Tax=Theileria parva TaxID=5875 RepID=Q4N5B6_THEPA|nr:RNA recognition motif family protein [Theileria parva strain Muguga]EAN32657.1 RNA recognition motif family protein [Theileria parva strain Muguga]|eukprot:XP_764940.1 spliceosome associated protein [Theileria parva strain Muguga]
MASRVLDILSLYNRNQEATLYIGNLDLQADEELLWEFFMQAGRVKSINVPRDKVTGQHQGFGFVEYETEVDADYALKILNFVKLYHKPLKLNKASKDKEIREVGAKLFVGNLDDEVDERLLHDTFSAFGRVLSAKMVRSETSGKTYAIVSFDDFEASDAALRTMNGQFLCNKPIHVSYAYKEDTKGERHGGAAERLIASKRPKDYSKHMAAAQAQMPIANTFVPPQMPMYPVMNPPPVMMPGLPQNMVNPPLLPQPNMGALPVGMPPLPMQNTVPVIPQTMPQPPMFNMN